MSGITVCSGTFHNDDYLFISVIMHKRVLDWIGDQGGWEGILVYTREIERLSNHFANSQGWRKIC